MTIVPHLILFGHDEMLHQTRRWLLERIGLAVSVASNQSELQQLLAGTRVELLAICHTVDLAESEKVIAAVRLAHPEIKIVRLSSNLSRSRWVKLDCASILLENPDVFLRSIRTILNLVPLPPAPIAPPYQDASPAPDHIPHNNG